MRSLLWKILLILVVIIIAAGGAFAMNIFRNDFEKQWEVLFKDVKQLNFYTSAHLVTLRDTKVMEYNIEGAVFTGATFSGVEWENVNANKATLTKVVFRKCKFIGGEWEDGTFTDVLFEDCEFIDTSFSGNTVANVRFRNCKINESGIGYLTGGKVEFDGCEWNMGAGGDSSCEFVIKNCTIVGVSFSAMKNGVSLLIEDSLLDEVNFSKSHFSTVTLRRVRQGEGPTRFNSVIAESFRFEDVDMTRGVSLARVKTTLVSIEGGTFRGATEGSTIGKIYARKANLFMYDMSEATMPYVNIDNCEILNLAIWECNAKELLITNSTADGIDATDFKADIVVWDNVTLDGKIDLTNAQVKDFRPTRLKRGPRLNLITTGSNMKF
jgi:uncharacterized protein YjbI with pentapeptide repeats